MMKETVSVSENDGQAEAETSWWRQARPGANASCPWLCMCLGRRLPRRFHSLNAQHKLSSA